MSYGLEDILIVQKGRFPEYSNNRVIGCINLKKNINNVGLDSSMRLRFRWMDIFALALVALCVYTVQGIAWPLSPGRDFSSYVTYFVQMWQSELGYPNTMLWRTPITPLFIGLINRIGGAVLLEISMGVLYAIAIICSYLIGAHFNRISGLFAALFLLCFPAYGHLFHELSSDSIFACAFVCWALFIINTSNELKYTNYLLHGLIVFLLVMIRPSSQLYVIFSIMPLCYLGYSIRRRLLCSALFLLVFFGLISSYKTYNFIRYDNFTVTHGSAAFIPLKKVMVHYRLVNLDNGPNTKKMAEAIEEHLLAHEPYLSYGVNKKLAIENGGSRVLYDMKVLSDEFFGKDSNYLILRKIACEAVISHPYKFLRSMIYDTYTIFFNNPVFDQTIVKKEIYQNQLDEGTIRRKISARLHDTTLYEDVIPISYYELKMYEDEDSIANILKLRRSIESEDIRIPQRDGDGLLAKIFNNISNTYPAMAYLLVISLLILPGFKTKRSYALFFVIVLSLLSILIPSLLLNQVWQYRQPFDAIFITAAVIAIIRGGSKFKG